MRRSQPGETARIETKPYRGDRNPPLQACGNKQSDSQALALLNVIRRKGFEAIL
jgi:hypothetical protein